MKKILPSHPGSAAQRRSFWKINLHFLRLLFSFSFFCFTINTLNQLKFLTWVKRFRLLRMKLCYFFIRNGSKWGAVAEWYKSLHCWEKITKARLSLAWVIFTKPWRIRLNSKRPMSPKHSQNDFRATDLFTWKRRLCQVCVFQTTRYSRLLCRISATQTKRVA